MRQATDEAIQRCRAEHREFLRVLPILRARHLAELPPKPTESARRAAERRAEAEAIRLAGASSDTETHKTKAA